MGTPKPINRTRETAAVTIGVDYGSVNVKAVVFLPNTPDAKPVHVLEIPAQGIPLQAGAALLSDVIRHIGADTSVAIGITGAAAPYINGREPGVVRVNEVVAAAAAVSQSHPQAKTIFDLGGQFSKWIEVDTSSSDPFSRVRDFSMNGLCAAGCGTFMDQQASRLGMSPEELGILAMNAPRGAAIAGRCSVFAKSDMIHLQQKSTPVDEIAYGLCLALSRTFISTVLKGRRVSTPVALVGGGVSNPGLVRAFTELLHIEGESILIPDLHAFTSAIGAAIFAADLPGVKLRDACKMLEQAPGASVTSSMSTAPSLRSSREDLQRPSTHNPEPRAASVSLKNTPVFMGIDVGSVSTNVVLLGPDLSLVAETYVPTGGEPIRALDRSFAQLRQRFGDGVHVLAAGATGSGRHLVERIAGVDLVKNEITAQLESATYFVPGVDTIFEIGGQDAKFISGRRGRLEEFEMNKICAAGTGSFLEEQAKRLGVSIVGEFSKRAFESRAPVDLGSRCTVFMDTEICRAMAGNAKTADLCAGLAYAVARNYLEKVVAGRPVGKTVVFQGGTSANAAVVSAFESLLGRRITVHPHGRVSGAIGAALLAAKARPSSRTAFRGWSACGDHTSRSFTCKRCENRCQVNRIQVGDRIAHFGDVCETFTAKDNQSVTRERDDTHLFAKRAKLLKGFLPVPRGGDRPKLGLICATLSLELLPFWTNLVDQLGFEPVLPSEMNRPAPSGGRGVPEEVCLPLKLAMDQVSELLEMPGVARVLLPSVQHLPTRQRRDRPSTCLYAQFLPDMARLAFGERILTPQLRLSVSTANENEGIAEIQEVLGLSRSAIKRAWRVARETQQAFAEARQELGRKVLAALPEYAVVVLGKPYNLHDPLANLNMAHHLEKAGLFAIPMDLLPLDDQVLSESWYMLPWHLNRDQVRALQLAAERANLFPIHVSSYGCGPDAFTLKHLESAWGARTRLFLEFDEHRGEAGLITRIEAFADEIRHHVGHRPAKTPLRSPRRRPSTSAPKGIRALLPNTSPHVHAYAGALNAAGYETRILEAPTEASIRLGEGVSSERECHPFTIIAGDLVNAIAQSDIRQGDRFFLPGTRLPCLLSQYGDGFRKILEKRGEGRLEIFDPHPGELNELLGAREYIRLYEALTIVDTLITAGALLQPRETVQDAVPQALSQCYRVVEKGMAERASMRRALVQCLDILGEVPLRPPEDRPIVGVTGDLYTRINAAGNGNLFQRLMTAGCTVWPSPFYAGSIDLELPQDARRWRARRAYTRALKESTLATLLKARANRLVTLLPDDLLPLCRERPFAEMQGYAEQYVSANTNHLIRGIVAKMVDFAKRGADGVISAIGIGCMVGISASAAIGAIRKDHHDIPIISIAYGGKEGPAQQIQLETFIHQVRQRHRERVNGEMPNRQRSTARS